MKRGFLSKKFTINHQFIISGILLWILQAYILYAFFYVLREVFRVITFISEGQTLVVLSSREHFLYNLFYASIAVALGYMLSLKFVLSNSIFGQSRHTRRAIRRTLNDQGFFTWAFLLWFGKVTSVLGIVYSILFLQYDIDFLKEFPLFLVLLPVFLFFCTWPSLRKVLGHGAFKFRWLLVSCAIFLMMSFLFAFKDFVAVEKINQAFQSKSIAHVYDLEVPESETHQQLWRRHLVRDVYVVNDTGKIHSPLIFLNNAETPVRTENIGAYLEAETKKLMESELNQMVVNLHIDKRIRMRTVNALKQALRQDFVQKIMYSTGVKHSRYPTTYPLFKYTGIQQRLPPFYSQLQHFLDSAEQLDASRYTIRLPGSPMYRIDDIAKQNRVEISVDAQAVYLNGQPIEKDKLQMLLYKLMKKYSPNFAVIYSPSEEITYERYIAYLDLIHTVIYKLRNELFVALYAKPYTQEYTPPESDTVEMRYPENVIEWTPEENRLNKLIR